MDLDNGESDLEKSYMKIKEFLNFNTIPNDKNLVDLYHLHKKMMNEMIV